MVRSACLAAGAVATVMLGGACASNHADEMQSDEQVLALSESAGAAALDKRFTTDRTTVTYGEDGTVTGGKRSQFEGKKQVAFGGDWDGKSYQKPEYQKTWWGGKKKSSTKQFVNNQDGSRFRADSLMMGRSAPQAGQRSAYDGKSAGTGGYHTGTARETGREAVPRSSGAGNDWLRGTEVQPRIIGYKQQQNMEIEETKKLLGRD